MVNSYLKAKHRSPTNEAVNWSIWNLETCFAWVERGKLEKPEKNPGENPQTQLIYGVNPKGRTRVGGEFPTTVPFPIVFITMISDTQNPIAK